MYYINYPFKIIFKYKILNIEIWHKIILLIMKLKPPAGGGKSLSRVSHHLGTKQEWVSDSFK